MAITIEFFILDLGFKIQLQKTILIVWNKFYKKGYLLSKTDKMNITIEFFVFELV